MSDTKSFTVAVVLPPRAAITQDGVNVSLSFPTVNGKHYKVQFKNSLNAPTWTDLPGSNVTGTGSNIIVTDTFGTQRFYVIVALD